jgi:LysM repeat protein
MARYPEYEKKAGMKKWILPVLIALLVVCIVIAVVFINPFKKSNTGGAAGGKASAAGGTNSLLPASGAGGSAGQNPAEPNTSILSQVTSSANPMADKLIAEATAAVNAQPPLVIEARQKLNDVLSLPMTAEQQKLVKDQMALLADKWLFSKTIFAEDSLCGSYKVKSGDRLALIAQENRIPYEILLQINGIPKPEALQAGATIKIVKGPFRVKVHRSTFTLELYLQDTFVRSFKIGIGKTGRETPKGLWIVKAGGKMIKPRWTDPDTNKTYESDDPDYPLGSRWIALEGVEGDAKGREGFAIHGTKVPEEVGAATSRGCIRMYNGEVILMYNALVPTFSKVEVVD